MKFAFASTMLFSLLMAWPAHAQSKATAAGFWEQSDDKGEVGAWFVFAEKDGFFEGRLVKMFVKPGEPLVETCSKCTGDQKNAPMLGLTIVNGMKRYGLKYKDGSILDPRDGSVYHAEMELSADGQQLSVRGYLLIPLLGRSQIWRRLPDDAIAPEDIPPENLPTDTQSKDASPKPSPKDASPKPSPKDASPKPSPKDASPKPSPKDVKTPVANP